MNAEKKQITIKDIDDFILSLNDESNKKSLVIVEGKKDVEAFNHFRGATNFVDHCTMNYKKIILLLDSDRKGKIITKKIISQLNGKDIDLTYNKKLQRITNGRIKKIEEIKTYYKDILEHKYLYF